MNIVREDLKDLSSLLKVTVNEADYNTAVDKKLHEYKRKANIPGFRPGMVPMGVVNKMFRKEAIAEEAYRAATDACSKYFEENKIDYLGDLLPSDEQQPLDFDTNTSHEFVFEFAVSPEVKIELSPKDKLTRYNIKVDKGMEENFRSSYLRKFGRLVDADKVESEDALNVTLDNEDMNITEAYVGLISMNDEQRKPFIGKKEGDVMNVNVNELYPTAKQRASILQLKEDELDGINPEFKLTITKIRRFAEPELTPDFFKMAFPDGSVTDEATFKKYIKSQIEAELERETGYLFAATLRDYLIEKADLKMPVEFLKRWLAVINEDRFTQEEIERDFAPFLEMMKWSIIRKHYIDSLKLEITPDEALEEAKNSARAQFAQYGMGSVADDMLVNYAQQMLQDREQSKKIYEQLFDNKVIEAATPAVTVESKSVSAEEYGKVVEARSQQ